MPVHITLTNLSKQETYAPFICEDGQSILEAASKAGYLMPYSCRNGACGSCKGNLLNGAVDYGNHQAQQLTEEEKAAGKALFCCAKPQSDCSISVREVRKSSDAPLKKLPARVDQLDKVTHDVMRVVLKLPANEQLQYQAGQYVDILMRDGKRRSFSIANAPHTGAHIELHIRHLPNGAFTEPLFTTGKVKDIWRFEGPHGSFYLREDSDKPMIMLCSGTGFAPIKAIIEHSLEKQYFRPMVVYWGGRRPSDLYDAALVAQWAQAHPHISFVPVISEAKIEDAWQGRQGFVHHAVMEDFPDLSGYEVYACGVPIMVDSAKKDFVAKCRLPEDAFYADAFTVAGESGQ
ncbi:MAG: hypothetical protein RLZZ502_1224 [Pseudomonadota bacterium]|jgi:CDP-4-dehydro-6-deoxyglucose reductase